MCIHVAGIGIRKCRRTSGEFGKPEACIGTVVESYHAAVTREVCAGKSAAETGECAGISVFSPRK